MRQKKPLCQPYDPFTEHPTIYDKIFLPGKIHISLRPFHIAHDLPLINGWLNDQLEKVKDIFQYTEDYYTTLLDSPNAQPLMGMIDQQPAFQADIYLALLGPDRLIESTSLNENDFILVWMANGEKDFRFLAGIAELDEMSCDDQVQSYYIISRQRFLEIQFGLPLFPDAEKKPQIA